VYGKATRPAVNSTEATEQQIRTKLSKQLKARFALTDQLGWIPREDQLASTTSWKAGYASTLTHYTAQNCQDYQQQRGDTSSKIPPLVLSSPPNKELLPIS
jgi:hypothetical protein